MPLTIPDLVFALRAEKQKGVKRYPCKSIRASSLGYAVPELGGCLRRGVYEFVAWQEKELWSVDSLIRFEEGNHQEKIVLRDLSDAGFTIIEQQTPFEWAKYNITGHIDGKLLLEGEAIPIEIKSMSPFIFQAVHTFEDFKKKPWTRAYMIQMTLYLLMNNSERGVFILKDKSSGQIRQINIELDYELGEIAIHSAERINRHLAEETLPERVKNIDICKDCPFKMTCLPDQKFGAEMKIADDPNFVNRIDEYYLLEENKKRAAHLWEEIRMRVLATMNGDAEIKILVGPYFITAKKDARGAVRVGIEKQ